MRLLLDSHAFLWFVWSDARLSVKARDLIQDPGNEVLLSLATAWEISIKVSLGKLALDRPVTTFFREHVAANQLTVLPLSLDHATRVSELPFHHRDPFDRLLVAQCLAEQLPLVSVDEKMDAYGIQRIW